MLDKNSYAKGKDVVMLVGDFNINNSDPDQPIEYLYNEPHLVDLFGLNEAKTFSEYNLLM